MKRWIILVVSILFLIAWFIILWRFPLKNILNVQNANNEKILELEEKIIEIKDQFDLFKPVVVLEDKEDLLIDENESIEKTVVEIIPKKESVLPDNKTTSETTKTIETTKEDPIVSTNITKKIWYINKVYKDGSIAKILFDEIVILSKEECEWLEICFKNESKKTSTFILSNSVEIYSYFVNYLVSWEIRKTKKLLLPCFLEFFAEDDADDYTRFNKIPYWITLENGKVTKIEEQTVVWLYE